MGSSERAGSERACGGVGLLYWSVVMAKTATAPFSHSLAQSVAHHAREQGRGSRSQGGFRAASIEERTAVLETRWEQTVPSLATKADLRDLENRQLKWGIGAGIALLGVFAAVFIANTARMDALDAKLDASVSRLDERMDRLDAKIDRLDAKLDARFDAIMVELREQRGK